MDDLPCLNNYDNDSKPVERSDCRHRRHGTFDDHLGAVQESLEPSTGDHHRAW